MKILLVLGLLFSYIGYSDVIDIREVSTEVRYTGCDNHCNMRHSFLDPDKDINYSVLHTTELTVYEYLLFENKFFFDGASQVDFAGLEYRVGMEFPANKPYSIDFGKWHHSSHAVDKTVRDGRYPLTDALYLRINWRKK